LNAHETAGDVVHGEFGFCRSGEVGQDQIFESQVKNASSHHQGTAEQAV